MRLVQSDTSHLCAFVHGLEKKRCREKRLKAEALGYIHECQPQLCHFLALDKLLTCVYGPL